MNKLFEKLIDYSLFKNFEEELLIKSLIIPIKKEGIYFEFFSCEDSDFSSLNLQAIAIEEKISKEDIQFFFNDLNLRKELYHLCESSLNSSENSTNYIEEFFNLFINKRNI